MIECSTKSFILMEFRYSLVLYDTKLLPSLCCICYDASACVILALYDTKQLSSLCCIYYDASACVILALYDTKQLSSLCCICYDTSACVILVLYDTKQLPSLRCVFDTKQLSALRFIWSSWNGRSKVCIIKKHTSFCISWILILILSCSINFTSISFITLIRGLNKNGVLVSMLTCMYLFVLRVLFLWCDWDWCY